VLEGGESWCVGLANEAAKRAPACHPPEAQQRGQPARRVAVGLILSWTKQPKSKPINAIAERIGIRTGVPGSLRQAPLSGCR
jgi:hypothetical protein